MNKNYFAILFLIFSSCVATQKDMIILQSQIDDLNSNIYTLKKNQADLTQKIDEVNKTIISFTETSKDLTNEMTKLSSKIDEYGLLTDKKINQLSKNIPQTPKDEDETSKEAKLFSKCTSAYSSGKTKLALDLLKEFISKYPNSQNIDVAYFYLGEILFYEAEFRDAAIMYAKIISGFSSFSNIDYVKLKYALSLFEMKDSSKEKEAISYIKEVEKNAKDQVMRKLASVILNEKTKHYNKKN